MDEPLGTSWFAMSNLKWSVFDTKNWWRHWSRTSMLVMFVAARFVGGAGAVRVTA